MTPATLLWTDPPYGTDSVQIGSVSSYRDPRREEATKLTVSTMHEWARNGSMAPDAVYVVCLDDRTIHQVVCGLGELGFNHHGDIIWESHLGRPRTTWWPRRHATMATFTFRSAPTRFDPAALPRTERLAPKTGYRGDKALGSVCGTTPCLTPTLSVAAIRIRSLSPS
jgi:hypothetical protein